MTAAGAIKPAALCELSQKGLLAEWPQRHSETLGFSMTTSWSPCRKTYLPPVSMPMEPFSRNSIFMAVIVPRQVTLEHG